MNSLSLGFKSEYIISQLECELIERDDYIVMRTPANPIYYFGNLLALKTPLQNNTKKQWSAIFQNEFADMPEVTHETYSWVQPNADLTESIKAFTDANYEYEEMHILSMPLTKFRTPTKLNEQVAIRELSSDADWQQWLNLSIAEQKGDHSSESLKKYLTGKLINYQNLSAHGHGQYMGAFIGDELIGYAGLYHLDDIARFQNVHVIPEYENQKIAKTILTRLISDLSSNVETLVIVADEHYHATFLYQSLGFKVTEREGSLCWWPERNRKEENV